MEFTLESRLRRNLRLCTSEGAFCSPYNVVVVPGNIFVATLVTGVLGLSTGQYGLMVSLPAWFNALQLVLVPPLSRLFPAKTLNLAAGWAALACWMVFVLALPLLPLDNPALTARILLVLFLAVALFQSINGVAWGSWIQEWIPRRIRGKYFGMRNSILGVYTMATVWAAGELIELWGNNLLGYQILLGSCGLLRAGSLVLQKRMLTPGGASEKHIHRGWTSQFRGLLGVAVYRQYLLFAALLAFSLAFAGPFGPVFMREFLHWEVGRQSTLVMLGSLAAIFSWPCWGAIIDRYGCKFAIGLSAVLWMGQNYLWCFLNPGNAWMLYPMWLWGGFFSGGVMLGSFNMLLKIIPREYKTAGISVHLAVTSVCAALAPNISGQLLQGVKDAGGDLHQTYRLVFAVGPTCGLLGLALLARVQEPAASAGGLTQVLGALRTFRQSLMPENMVMLANAILVRRPAKPRKR